MSKYYFSQEEGHELRVFFDCHGEYPCKTSIEFTFCGIGSATVVRCEECDQEYDITDLSVW